MVKSAANSWSVIPHMHSKGLTLSQMFKAEAQSNILFYTCPISLPVFTQGWEFGDFWCSISHETWLRLSALRKAAENSGVFWLMKWNSLASKRHTGSGAGLNLLWGLSSNKRELLILCQPSAKGEQKRQQDAPWMVCSDARDCQGLGLAIWLESYDVMGTNPRGKRSHASGFAPEFKHSHCLC